MDAAALAVHLGYEHLSAILAASDRRTPLTFTSSPTLPTRVWAVESGLSAVPVDGASVVEVGELVATAPADQAGFVADALAVLLSVVAAQAHQLATVNRVLLVVDDQWGPRRRALVRDAAHRAGLPDPVLINATEAIAAHAATLTPIQDGASLVVCDLGDLHSTVAVTVRSAAGWQTLASIPSPATATAIDEAVLASLELDTNLHHQLTTPVTPEDQHARREVLTSIRAVSRSMPPHDRVAIVLPEPHPPVLVTSTQVHTARQTVRTQAIESIRQAIRAADIDPETLAGAVVTGPATTEIGLTTTEVQTHAVAPTVLTVGESASADGALTLHGGLVRPDTLHVLRAHRIGLPHLAAVIAPIILGSLLLLEIVSDAQDQLPSSLTTIGYYASDLNAYISTNAYALAALCAALGLTAAGRIGAAAWDRYDHDNTQPGTHARQAGRTFAAAAGLGLTIAAIFGLLGETLFAASGGDGGRFLRATILAALTPTALAGAVGLLAPSVMRIRTAWIDELHYPVTPLVLAVVGVMATEAAGAGPPWLDTIDYSVVQVVGGRAGMALLGFAIAFTVTRSRLARLGLAVVLGVGGGVVYTITTARLFTFAYLVAVAAWWIVHVGRLAWSAVPRRSL